MQLAEAEAADFGQNGCVSLAWSEVGVVVMF